MDLEHRFFDFFNVEERSILITSLRTLQLESDVSYCKFWGKILGVERDYYIAITWDSDALSNRTYFYSLNMRTWTQLPSADNELRVKYDWIQLRFRGDPQWEFEQFDPIPKPEGEELDVVSLFVFFKFI